MPQLVAAFFIILAAIGVLRLRFCDVELPSPPGSPPGVETSVFRAPVRCGPYFLYIHPSYYKLDRYGRAANRYKVFSVSRTPPDEKTDKIEQLWAYGVMQATIQTDRPVLFNAETLDRNAMRPAMWSEIGWGDYIGDYYCKPYKPGTLQCREHDPWCDLPSSKP